MNLNKLLSGRNDERNLERIKLIDLDSYEKTEKRGIQVTERR